MHSTSSSGHPSLDGYHDHCRPKLADLLHAVGLDVTYVRATGATLVDATGREITDFVGGFGAALLGHNPSSLKRRAVELIQADTPFHTQVSVRSAAGRLGARLSNLVPGEDDYLCHLTNSGTEAVESALKHAYKVKLDALRSRYEAICRTISDFYHEAEKKDGLVVPGGKGLLDFRDDIEQANLAAFENYQLSPMVLAFQGAFHGKTSGSLKTTYNKSYREGYEGLSAIRTAFLDPSDPLQIEQSISSHRIRFLVPVLDGNGIHVETIEESPIFACILETIQGEGGIRPLPHTTLERLAKIRHRPPLIVDEIQTGCGRTGTFFCFEQGPLRDARPEYVLLSKALGGGMAKIGATLIRSDVYDPDFGILHTSTFGEDDFASEMALCTLDALASDDHAALKEVTRKGGRLKAGLEALRSRWPNVVRDVRGEGLLLGLEFTDFRDRSPFLRAAGRQGILSILVASYLLHHHRQRLLAPLTNLLKGNPGKIRHSILRIQPPVVVDDLEIDRLLASLDEVCAILDASDERLLVGHLLGWSPTDSDRRSPRPAATHPEMSAQSPEIDARVGFVIHPTELAQVKAYYFPSLRDTPVSDKSLRTWWNRVCRFLEPVHVHREIVRSSGFAVECNLVMIPYLPQRLADRNLPTHLSKEVRDKVQDAVTVAKELGDENIPVSMVGLGAFASIACDNGTLVNRFEVPVTTGNAYTTALTLQGIEAACHARGQDLSNARVAVVGAGGNIGQVLSILLSRRCSDLLLVGSPSPGGLERVRTTSRDCESPESTATISCTTDFDSLADRDVVVLATNSSWRDLLRPDHVRSDAIVCCTSVPSNLSSKFADHPGILAFDGGLARLPEQSRIEFVGLPGDGLSYGCLAETILLGFEGRNHSFAIGPLRPELVQESARMARDHGFRLGSLRLGNQVLAA